MVSSTKVLICLIVVLCFSTLSLSQTNGQKTKPNKDSIPAFKLPTLPTSIEEDIDSELEDDPILPLDSKSSMAPHSGSAWSPVSPSPEPDSETEPDEGPAPSSRPKPSPAPSSRPKPSMSPSPSSETDPEDGPAPSSTPKAPKSPSPSSGTEPDEGPAPSSRPKPSPAPSSRPKPSMSPSPSPETNPEDGPAPSSTPKAPKSPSPSSGTEPEDGPAPSSKPKPSLPPSSKPKPAHEPSSAPAGSDDGSKSTTAPSSEPKPTVKPPPSPKQGSKSPPQPTPPQPTAKPTFPYQTVNNFCLYKRLSVNRIFCLKVLKNPKAANATADDYTPLLQVATEATTAHVIKTLKYLKTLYKDKNGDPSLKPSIRECVVAYQEIAEYIKHVLADASQESAIAGLDGEVIIQDINICIRAVPKKTNTEIGVRNQIAKNYAKLLIDISDNR